jgi:hypothetical protein
MTKGKLLEIFKTLSEQEQDIYLMRQCNRGYGRESYVTYEEIGEVYGLSRERIRRIYDKAECTLRKGDPCLKYDEMREVDYLLKFMAEMAERFSEQCLELKEKIKEESQQLERNEDDKRV